MREGMDQRDLPERNQAGNVSSPFQEASQLRSQIRRLKNQQEFLDILANVWPLPRIVSRIEKLETRVKNLEEQLQQK